MPNTLIYYNTELIEDVKGTIEERWYHRHKLIDILLIGTACLPCFDQVVVLPATI
jgi:hypothetical protein